jgi:hypothetical protein
MTIKAYTYEADTHCIDCTQIRFGNNASSTMQFTNTVDENGIWDDPDYPTLDGSGNPIGTLFSWSEWAEYDPNFLANNNTQYLTCGDCLEVIEEYTHIV